MTEPQKTREQLIAQVATLRQRLVELEGQVAQSREEGKTLARLASFPEQNPNPVIEVDRQGQVIYSNPLARARFPDLAEAGLAHPLLQDLDQLIRTFATAGDAPVQREVAVAGRTYEQVTQPIPGSDLVRIYAHDITERQQAEAALRESEERFHNIFEHTNDAIFLLDPAQDAILDANSKAGRLLGYDREDLLRRPISAIHPTEMDRLRSFARSVATAGSGWTDELACVTRTGQSLAAEISASMVEIGGRTYMIALVRDTTERQRAAQVLADEVQAKYNYEEIVGQSPSLQEVLTQVELVAPTDTSVLIVGETGTGKELICRALHHASQRRDYPLIKLNCAAIPSGLIESELFGHEKGAFTGAIAQKRGRFELAHNGTLFLDEIGDIPLETQPKLLRLLQEQEFERVGGTRTIAVDVRVIAATHRELAAMVQEGTFREDLFYRLNVFPVPLPPLRQRPEDIPSLAHFFVHRISRRLGRPVSPFSPRALERLVAYAWPGNVRELENIVERAVILCQGQTITEAHVQVGSGVVVQPAGGIKTLQELEKEHIGAALAATGGKVSGLGGAAELLGLKPTTLESRMKKLGIQKA